MEQPAKPEQDKGASETKQDSQKMEKRVGVFSGAKLRKRTSNEERDAALSQVGQLKAELKHSNDTNGKLMEEIIQLQSKLDKKTTLRDAALSNSGELKTDLKATTDSEGQALEEAIDMRFERDMMTTQRDAALAKIKQLETEVEGLKKARIVRVTSPDEPTNKKRKIDTMGTPSTTTSMQKIQDLWTVRVEELKEALLTFNLDRIPGAYYEITLGYLMGLLCALDDCSDYDPEGKGLGKAERLSNLAKYRSQVDRKYFPSKWQCFGEVIFGHMSRFVKQHGPCSRCVKRDDYGCIQVKNLAGTLSFRYFECEEQA